MVIKARLNTARVFHYFDAAGAVVNPALLTGVIKDSAGATVETLVLTQNTVTPNLYLSDPVTLTEQDGYTVFWSYNAAVVLTEQLAVGIDLIPDARIDVATDLRYTYSAGETFSLKVFDDAGELVDEEDAVYDAALLAYEFEDYTFTEAGDFFVVWYREIAAVPTPIATAHYMVLTPYNKFAANVVAETEDDVPFNGASLIVSDADGTRIARAVLDSSGQTVVDLDAGDYVFTLHQPPKVFSTNNWEVTIVDPAEEGGNNNVHLITGYTTPTVSDPAPPADMCTIYTYLYGMDGRPIANAQVLVTYIDPPTVLTGNIVADTSLVFRTDANGYVSFDLLQGIEVEVAVVPVSIRRRFTVPSGADAVDPVDLATLVAAADDAFTIIRPSIPAAPRRNL